jgi:hypothetical protein
MDALYEAVSRLGSVRAACREIGMPRRTVQRHLAEEPLPPWITIYGPRLLPQHAELLWRSGVSPAVAAARGYASTKRMTRAELRRHRFSTVIPGMLVPVWTIGCATSSKVVHAWSQIRRDLPEDATWRQRRRRYHNARSARAVVDVSPAARDLVLDRSRTLYVTESPRKADGAVSRGLACVAIVGARLYDVGGDAWERVGVRDRDVVIVFDGDAARKPDVRAAESHVQWAIGARGGRVTVRRLPGNDGLDDYLARHPDADAERLLDDLPRA